MFEDDLEGPHYIGNISATEQYTQLSSLATGVSLLPLVHVKRETSCLKKTSRLKGLIK